MAFEFTVRGHSADPHNLKVKTIFEQTVLALRKEIDSSGSVTGFGYSTDPTGTLELDANSISYVPGSVDAAQLAVTQAEAGLVQAAAIKSAADAALANAKKQEAEAFKSVDEPDTTDDNVNASDAAVARAKELGVDLATVTGTGKGGAIKVSDVEAAAKTPA